MARRRTSVAARPRTKPSVAPFRLTEGTILLSRDVYGLGRRLSDDDRGTIWRLLHLADGNRGIDQIVEELRKEDPNLEPDEVRSAVADLQRIGVIEDAALAPPPELSEEERQRYARNLEFFSLATLGTSRSAFELQGRLKRARVTVLGVGGIGCATAVSLAAAGVGHLRVIDPDVVELSNLNRQLLYTSEDVGRPKAEVAAERLSSLNPHVSVSADRTRANGPEDLRALMEDCDLFVLGADRPHEILLWTNDVALAEDVPWLENSYGGARCAVALFVPGKTPCVRCLQRHLETREGAAKMLAGTELFPLTASNPVLAATAAIAGHMGALQAVYFLSGLPTPAEGALLHVNLWRPDDVRVVRPPFWPECPACGSRRAPSGPLSDLAPSPSEAEDRHEFASP